MRTLVASRIGAACYAAWGIFHCKVAYDIYRLGTHQAALAQGRLYQLAAYMLSIAVFAVAIAARYNWRNDRRGYWLNLCVVGWADAIWVAVVVLPGYVDLFRGLLPPAIYVAGALLTTYAQHRRSGPA
ncbi:MAG TPA: hypothetical protein VME63_11125 [Dyella sp.]|uniref:hypothetical protein n=1 Tax=Dyella sp. TaxID=1869338 RepID=UPI002C0583C5|nr:hypothetical protein [Dyella sp.]HTV85955.1 hypothetical protein [Dyella sp.]